MDWELYEKVMKPLRQSQTKTATATPVSKKEEKKEAPYSNRDLFKKIIGS